MEEHHHHQQENPKSTIPMGGFARTAKIMVYVAAVILIAIIYFKYGNPDNGGGILSPSVPKEVQIKYMPADFRAKIDEENALAILSNPIRYTREFDELIYDFNVSLLNHVTKRMNLPDTTRSMALREYDKQHPYLRKLYFDDFVALKDTADNLAPVWYETASTNAVDVLHEVASKYTCTLINQVLVSVLQTHNGNLYVMGNKSNTPCGVALSEGLKPMIDRLKERAAIEDFGRSKGLMEERVERAIAELATMEVRDKKAISRQLQTKIWGFNVSSSDVEVSAVSITKVGFKLDQYFDIQLNGRRKVVTITLPEPMILSTDVYPRLDKLDIGWMREVGTVDFNANIDLLRKEFRRDVMDSNVFNQSKDRARELMETMFSPLISSMDKRFILRVEFKNVNSRLDDRVEGDPFEEDNPKPVRG